MVRGVSSDEQSAKRLSDAQTDRASTWPICAICGRPYPPHATAHFSRYCSQPCKRRANTIRNRERRAQERLGSRRTESKTALCVRRLRADPDLENWQLAERGFSEMHIRDARKVTGIESPDPAGNKSLIAALRSAAPETYREDAERRRPRGR